MDLASDNLLILLKVVVLTPNKYLLIDVLPHWMRANIVKVLCFMDLSVLGRDGQVGIYLADPVSFFLYFSLNRLHNQVID
jgi:hypothetical protein